MKLQGHQAPVLVCDSEAVEPLRRASEGDPEIAETCSLISYVRVNEEPHPQVLVGEFSYEEEREARSSG